MEYNSTTNDSMVMKIAHAQLHMCTNIMYKFQSSMCKTVGEKLRKKLCPLTDGRAGGRTARAIPVYPLHFFVCGGYKKGHPRNIPVKIFQNLTNGFREDFLRISSCP